jgi:predicted hydrocarbon binding protein
MIILRRDVIRVMREALERIVGDQAAPFLSFLASGIGIHEGSIFRDTITSTGQEQRAGLENLVRSAFEDTNLGLGKIQIRALDFDKVTANVLVANCFEAMESGPSEQPDCMFTSGFLAGLFAELFDRTVQAKELHCISQGAPECEFELSLAEGEVSTERTESKPELSTPQAPSAPSNELKIETPKPPVAIEPPKTPTRIETPTKIETPVQPQTSGSKPASTPIGSKEGQPASSKISETKIDSGVERANRIAQRKQGFWERHFKKN